MTNENLTPRNFIGKKKEGEIHRFQTFLAAKNLLPEEIQRVTGISIRTITNSIYEGKPLGSKLLRQVHLNYGVSIDWLVSGVGKMFIDSDERSTVVNTRTEYNSTGSEAEDIKCLVDAFLAIANDSEKAWLETQIKFNLKNLDDYDQ